MKVEQIKAEAGNGLAAAAKWATLKRLLDL